MAKSNEKNAYILETIKRFWYGYKVCDGCDAVLKTDVYVCPICTTYRFNTEKKDVLTALQNIISDDYVSIFGTGSFLEEDID